MNLSPNPNHNLSTKTITSIPNNKTQKSQNLLRPSWLEMIGHAVVQQLLSVLTDEGTKVASVDSSEADRKLPTVIAQVAVQGSLVFVGPLAELTGMEGSWNRRESTEVLVDGSI